MKQPKTHAVFYVTVDGESDVEWVGVARDKGDAIAAFRRETGSDDPEYEWEAHKLSDDGSEDWCAGYMACLADIEEREEVAAARRKHP